MMRAPSAKKINTPRQILFASLVGTAVEFFDFYIYATAAVLVFPRLFFPASDPASSVLASLATFAIAFRCAADRVGGVRALWRPDRAQADAGAGAVHHGHVDVCDRDAALVPDHRMWPRRCCWPCAGSGRGSGWEANGAGRCCWRWKMLRQQARAVRDVSRSLARRWGSFFPGGSSSCSAAGLRTRSFSVRLADSVPGQLGAGAAGALRSPDDHGDAGLRGHGKAESAHGRSDLDCVPPAYARTGRRCVGLFRNVRFVLPDDGVCAFVGTTALQYDRSAFLVMQLISVLFFAVTIPISAWLAERGRRPVMFAVTVLIGIFGLFVAPLFTAGLNGRWR